MEDPDGGFAEFTEQIHASAVQFLIQRNNNDAAVALLACTFSLVEEDHNWGICTAYGAKLRSPQPIYEMLCDPEHPTRTSVKQAIEAVLPFEAELSYFQVRVHHVELAPEWKAQMLDIALGKEVHNQGISIKNQATMMWQNLRFRSESEKRIAVALDRAGVLFLPNCLARLTTPEGRKNKEPDFVICHQGRWGILEVDGEPYHPPSRTTDDHKRDQDFYAHGIHLVLHFDAAECYQQPDRVVKRFLDLLKGKEPR